MSFLNLKFSKFITKQLFLQTVTFLLGFFILISSFQANNINLYAQGSTTGGLSFKPIKYGNLSAIALIENGKLIGIVDCNTRGEGSGVRNVRCDNVAPIGISSGDTVTDPNSILLVKPSTASLAGVSKNLFRGDSNGENYYIITDNGNTKFLGIYGKIAQDAGCGLQDANCTNKINTYLKSQIKKTKYLITPVEANLLTSSQRQIFSAGKNTAYAFTLSNGVEDCTALFDKDNNKVVYSCLDANGKQINPITGQEWPSTCEKSSSGIVVFSYEGGGSGATCISKADADKIINNSVNGVKTTSSSADSSGGNIFSELASFLLKIVIFVWGFVFFLLNIIAMIVLFFLGLFTLAILDINPASLELIKVAEIPWSIIAGLGNLVILGAFIYVGFGYLFNISSLKKNLGDFILKIVYYAILLNFTLLGVATLYNIGFNAGNLIKFAYTNSTDPAKINSSLIVNTITSISNISFVRCGSNQQCRTPVQGQGDIWGQVTNFDNIGSLGQIFWSDSSNGLVNSIAFTVSEAIVLIMLLFAAYVFARLLYTVLYRLIFVWVMMVLSPLVLASYFSPIEGWQKIGKDMWSKFIKVVLFYPFFIFALILINSLSAGFNSSINNSFLNPSGAVAGSSDTFIKIISFVAVRGLQAIVALGALWYVVQYFASEFEKTMEGLVNGAVGAVKSGISRFQSGYKTARQAAFVAATPVRSASALTRWVGEKTGINDRLKKFSDDNTKKLQKTATNKKAPWINRVAARRALDAGYMLNGAGRAVGNTLNGTLLYDLENKAKAVKDLVVGSLQNSDKKLFKEIEERNAEEIERAIRVARLGFLIDDSNAARHEKMTRKQALRQFYDGSEEKDIKENQNKAKDAVVTGRKMESNSMVENNLNFLNESNGNNIKKYMESEQFRTILNNALASKDDSILSTIARNDAMRIAAQTLFEQGFITGDAKKATQEEYFAFLDSATKQSLVAQNAGQKNNWKFNNVNIADPEVLKIYDQNLPEEGKDQLSRTKKSSGRVANQKANNVFTGSKNPIMVGTEDSDTISSILSNQNLMNIITSDFETNYDVNYVSDTDRIKATDSVEDKKLKLERQKSAKETKRQNIKQDFLKIQANGDVDTNQIPREFRDYLKGFLYKDGNGNLSADTKFADTAADQISALLSTVNYTKKLEPYTQSEKNYQKTLIDVKNRNYQGITDPEKMKIGHKESERTVSDQVSLALKNPNAPGISTAGISITDKRLQKAVAEEVNARIGVLIKNVNQAGKFDPTEVDTAVVDAISEIRRNFDDLPQPDLEKIEEVVRLTIGKSEHGGELHNVYLNTANQLISHLQTGYRDHDERLERSKNSQEYKINQRLRQRDSSEVS